MSEEFEILKLKSENKKLKTRLVYIEALRIKQYDDAYPDVGMGMSWNACVYEALKKLKIKKEDINIDELI